MSEMVERVAIALYECDQKMLAMYKSGAESWPHDREGLREEYRGKARAIISVMREPTYEMVEAAGSEHAAVPPRESWQAMIDAALSQSLPGGKDGE